MRPLLLSLRERGFPHVQGVTLQPIDGRATIAALAQQVALQTEALCRETGASRIDVMGFSMGALATRYYVQRGGGRDRLRRFVSISGPHSGTWTAYALPFTGIREMRPRSALLSELDADVDPFGSVEVHCIYTPLDLTILPAASSELRGAQSIHRVPVLLHRWMLKDARVIELVAELLVR